MTSVSKGICQKRIPVIFRNIDEIFSPKVSLLSPDRRSHIGDSRPGFNGKRPRILLLDDNLIFLQALGRLLQKHEYDVDTVGCHEAALDRIAADASTYDLALVDLHLKGSSGWEFAKKLNHIPNTPPVIIMSGDVQEHSLNTPGNVKGFLTKPFSVKHIKEEIDNWHKSAISMS